MQFVEEWEQTAIEPSDFSSCIKQSSQMCYKHDIAALSLLCAWNWADVQ